MDCHCYICRLACQCKPGWFAPCEAERAAELLGMTLEAFFQTYLVADFYDKFSAEQPNVFALSPAYGDAQTGAVAPYEPRGRCVFYDDEIGCKIHDAKPLECRVMDHTTEPAETKRQHRRTAELWAGEQEQIERLLGEKPVAPDSDGSLSGLAGLW